MTTAHASAHDSRPAGISPTAHVLQGRPLCPGIALASTSRYGEDLWVLSPALLQVHQSERSLSFLTLPAQFRTPAKEYFYALLAGNHPDGMKDLRISSVSARFNQLREFLLWADERGISALTHVTAEHLTAYHTHVDSMRFSASTKTSKRAAVRSLWLYRSRLTDGSLPMDPFILWRDDAYRPNRDRRSENSTPRIPEQVIAPLLVWALRWIEEFADDIVRAQQEWITLRTRLVREPREQITRDEITECLGPVIDTYRRRHQPLPRITIIPPSVSAVDRPPVNMLHLARQAGLPLRATIRKTFIDLVLPAVEELGLDDATYLDTPVQGRVGTTPWLRAFPFVEIEIYVLMLQAACYTVIAYLTGMREAEVKHLQRGCVSVWRDEEDRPVRYRITSQAFKGEEDPTGVRATWITTAPVAAAVRVLEDLQAPDQAYLFASAPSSRAALKNTSNLVQTHATTTSGIKRLMQWVNDFCMTNRRDDGIPDVDGQPWKIQLRQFRRTLAWSIARQPGGSIAGAIQYRHHSVQMFEGYAGTSDSGFRAEVESEQALARGEKLGDIILSPTLQPLAGPGAAEAERRLAAMEQQIDFHGKVIPDRKRLERHMKRHDPHIYPGKFVTCVYNPDRALCRRENTEGPSLANCQPLKCRNVALTTDNVTAFQDWIAEIDATLTDQALAPYVRARMEALRTEVLDFLDAEATPDSRNQEDDDAH